MFNDMNGIRTVSAHVRLARHENEPKAFTRNGAALKSNKVRVESVTGEDFDEANYFLLLLA